VLREAFALHQKGQLAQAATVYRQVLAQNPQNTDALHLLGVLESQRGNAAAGLELLDRAIQLKPQNADFHFNRGNALQTLKRFEEALASFDRALAIKPDHVDVLNNRGNVLRSLERLNEALASYDRALAIQPEDADAIFNRGVVLHDLKRFDEALACYDGALVRRPDFGELLLRRGNALRDLKRMEEALASYDRALAISPGHAEVLNNRGNVLKDLKRLDQALESYDRALAILPDHADILNNRGNLLKDLNRPEEALACYDRALALQPDFAEALNNRGTVLTDLKRLDEALTSYDHALAIKPDYPFLPGNRLHAKLKICDWSGLAEDFAAIAEQIEAGAKASSPFAALGTLVSAAIQRTCAENYVREKYPPNSSLPRIERRSDHDCIRLGYFSADFHNHATAHLFAEMFERHDRARFELNAFSLGPTKHDSMRARLKNSFERFIEAGSQSDQDLAQLARSLEIDIAVDLNGFTKHHRTGIFALRAAPIQVNYLGYPGTMGAGYIDYLIADATVIPPDEQRHYAEKIVYLPDTYQPNDTQRPIAEKPFTRAECNLPPTGFVFACFNNSYKILPEIFDIWMRLLENVEGSVLWLLEDNASAERNLQAEAQRRGIVPQRLVFAPRRELSEHLARHRLADLFLDTLPYNAHTTASDALWAGLPVLTCLGETFAGRVAGSLLKAMGLPELITTTLAEYEARARFLAGHPEELPRLRAKLAANRLTTPLFDTPRFTRHVESAYALMWQRHLQGLSPTSFSVPSILDPRS